MYLAPGMLLQPGSPHEVSKCLCKRLRAEVFQTDFKGSLLAIEYVCVERTAPQDKRNNWRLTMSVIGETHEETFDVCDVNVAYPDGQGGTNTYDAPKGTAILSYRAIERGRSGNSGYNFSLQGDNSAYVSLVEIEGKFRSVFDFIENNKKDEYKNKVDQILNEAKRVAQMTASTHSRLTTNWHCHHNGNDFDRRGGNLNLSVAVKLIKTLDNRNIDDLIKVIIDAISKGARPEDINPVV
jgi:hypothetical protein